MDKVKLHPLVLGMIGLGAVGVVASWFSGAQRFGANWILWSLVLLSVALGSLFLVALEHLTRAHWSIVLRRVPERISGILPAIAVLFAVGAAVGIGGGAFSWATADFRQSMLTEPHLHSKAVWYSTPFFLSRLAVVFGAWLISWHLLARGSVKQDEVRDPRFSLFAKRFSAPFMWIFALSISVVGIDWLMGMSPRWYSTIFGAYTFAGVFLSGLAATVLCIAQLKRQGRLSEVREDHLYSLGGFMFAFTVFWAYIAFSQFMLIWYANMPEETFWFKTRLSGGWYGVTLLLSFIRFFVPFFALLSREVKMDINRLAKVAWLILLGQALDFYWIIFPELDFGPLPGWQEISFALFFAGLGIALIQRRMQVGQDLPVGDPNLEAGLNYHL